MAVDRSKRYANPPKGKKGGDGPGIRSAEKTAEKTAGDPPSTSDEKGANHKTDPGPDGQKSPAVGDVAERQTREMADMHKRHNTEMTDMHERHAKEHGDMGKRHAKEVAPNEDEAAATSESADTGKGPKLGKTEDEGKKGSEP